MRAGRAILWSLALSALPSCNRQIKSQPDESLPESVDSDGGTTPDGWSDQPWISLGAVEAEARLGAVRPCAAPISPPLLGAPVPVSDWQGQAPGSPERPAGWGLAVEDLDGDGHLDVFLPQPGPDELFLGDGTGRFTRAPFPDGQDESHGVSAADYDGDGDVDLYVTNAGPDRLYRNDGCPGCAPAFTDVTAAAGLPEDPWLGVSAAWADIDQDGDLDLAVGNYYTVALHAEDAAQDIWIADPNALYVNNGDGTFTDASDRLKALTPADGDTGWTYALGWFDMDGDLDPDLYVINDKGALGYSNRLLENDGAGRLRDDGGARYTDLSLQGMGMGVGDLNGDLQPDLLLSNTGGLSFLSSAGDWTWYENAAALGIFPDMGRDQYVAWGGEMADFDNDSLLDLYLAFGLDELDPEAERDPDAPDPLLQPDALMMQRPEMPTRFPHEEALWRLDHPGVNRGAVWADLNGDGVLDRIVRDLFGPADLRLSACSARAWAKIQLRQPSENPRAIGARLTVYAGDQRLTRWITAGSTGIASSGPAIAHVGLGGAAQIDRIEIQWPDGAASAVTGAEGGPLPVNAPIEIVRAE